MSLARRRLCSVEMTILVIRSDVHINIGQVTAVFRSCFY